MVLAGAFPRDKGVTPVMEYLTDNLGSEAAVREAMEHLADVTMDDTTSVDNDGKHVIVKAMMDYLADSDIQAWGCQILLNLITTGTGY